MDGAPGLERYVMAAVATLGLIVATVACDGSVTPSGVSSASTIRTHPDTLVIVGANANHESITRPLVEVFPAADGDPAVLRLAFESVGNMGIEGGVAFASAYAIDGTLVLDRIVEIEGDQVEMPAGDYTFRFYFRPCDGFCGLLDPDVEYCTFQHSLVAGGLYDVQVTGGGFGQPAARCSVDPQT